MCSFSFVSYSLSGTSYCTVLNHNEEKSSPHDDHLVVVEMLPAFAREKLLMCDLIWWKRHLLLCILAPRDGISKITEGAPPPHTCYQHY